MYTSNFRKSLIEIAEEEGSNLISKLVAYYYPSLDFSNREKLFESLLSQLELKATNQEFNFEKLKQDISNDSEIINIDDYEGSDYRIKEIEISNLKGIPELDASNPVPYGVSLTDENGGLNNAIILANNGVGKSSVFAGLEMIYAHEIGEKKIRTLNPDSLNIRNFEDYLKNVRSSKKPFCKVKTINGDFDLENKIFKNLDILKLLNPQSHFISEYDIIRNGQNYYSNKSNEENSIHFIVAESLGLSEYINCLNLTKQIQNYRRTKETSARNSIAKEIKGNNTLIKNNEAEIESKQHQIEELRNGRANNENQDNSDKLKELNELLSKPIDLNLDFQSLHENFQKYKNSYAEYSSIEISKRESIEKEFLEAGKEIFHEFDNCPYCLSSNLSWEEIRIKVEDRLSALNKLHKLDKSLRDSFKDALESLLNVLQSFFSFYELIESERNSVSKITALNQIWKAENDLYLKLAPFVNDQDLFDYVKNLSQKSITTNTDFKILNDLLQNNTELFEKKFKKLMGEISAFIFERKKYLQNELNKLISKDNKLLTPQQSVQQLEYEIKNLREQIRSAKERNIEREADLLKAKKKVEYINQLKEEIISFNNKLELKVNVIVEQGFKAFKEPVEEIMNDYFQDDPQYELQINLKNFPIIIDGDEYTSKVIIAEIVNKNEYGLSTSPDQYFNTFRYKLFCLMISLSIALASRKMYKVNLPLVIDDLFYGSDFISKNTFSEFIQNLIRLFKNHTPDMPLQIILFTHDDFIYKSAIDGIENYALLDPEVKLDDYLLSRMFATNDKEIAESSSGFKYWNLIYN